MRKSGLIILLVVLSFVSCTQRNDNKNTEQGNSTEKIETKKPNLAVIDSLNIDSCKLVVSDFFDWYIKSYIREEQTPPTVLFSPRFKKYPDGYCSLDIDEFKKSITDFKYFSKEFINFLINRNVECNEAILKDKITDLDDILNLRDETDKYCSFLFYDDWLGGQDYIEVTDFRIISTKLNFKKTKCIVKMESLTDYNSVHSKIFVEVIKEKDNYKINNIEVEF